ncbi:MAG: GFA family protein [Rhodospirillaceae bacterium]|jgi:hypothetical protein|nr:GFA family protein [Rhodospirillaceae bacterium]MBT3626808.1 GFA family protein [Rhodospirillaceae bacterium]MBT3926301.1 GFA family protein [Rhodospirillaceae bacterium]MBT4428138.1 GFA family protein [Rhodospirillaceae bacterium]MBT5038438.1 GFA family protein [Rhodospirillaceae bacterium]
MKIDGGCHCGHISYEAEIDSDKVVACHCTDCQTMSGAPFRMVAFSVADGFKLLSGELKIYVKTAESGNKRQQSFCPECGTPIYAAGVEEGPKNYGIRVGSIRQRAELTPKLQVWSRSAQHWLPDLQEIKKLEQQPPVKATN